MTARTWQDDTELVDRTTWLIEASAGTGKTYQIAGLIVRLVAEHGIAIERILAITFTTAATAELRDRIRARLVDVLAAVRAHGTTGATGATPSDDPILASVLRSDRDRRVAIARLEVALRSFDVASISTIHGFSQRMLQEFAFDSGQDPELELLADTRAVVEQIVDDSLATLYANAAPRDLDVLAAAGVRRATLVKVVEAMSGPCEPAVVPGARAGEGLLDALTAAHGWAETVGAIDGRRRSDEGRAAADALRCDVEALRFQGNVVRAEWLASSERKVAAWLADGAPPFVESDRAGIERLHRETLRAAWKGGDVADRPWVPFAAEFEDFCRAHAAFWATFAPLAAFAVGVRGRVEAELARRRQLTFNSMLARLAERVQREGRADSPIATRIRDRYDVAFVDEFQDTDAAQWAVIEAAFHGHRRLFLIGDPKQAIYAFRGADVHVYLDAARTVPADHHRTMATNWRSDPRAVAAMNHLWRADSGAFDQPRIDYVTVAANKPDRLVPVGAGLVVRWVDARVKGGVEGEPLASKEIGLVARLAAREALAWLDGERAAIVQGNGSGACRAVTPGDVAILVNDHREASEVRAALTRLQIPAVAASKGSVFDTPVATWIASWLDAVAAAGRDREARTAVVTPLFGWRADELAWALAIADRGDDARAEAEAAGIVARDWNGWTDRLRGAAEGWWRGFARTFDRALTDCGAYPRVLAMADGERHATDLRHLFELLHVEERARHAAPRALAAWLRARAGARDETATQRLESDARAVRIETVHVSKGLEYPIVLLPYAWSARADGDDGAPLLVHGETGLALNVESKQSVTRQHVAAHHRREGRREALRKLYVALTRARHRTVAWYGPIGTDGRATEATALGRLLMRGPQAEGFDDATMPVFGAKAVAAGKSGKKRKSGKDGTAGDEGDTPSAWTAARERLASLVAKSDGAIAVEIEQPIDPTPRVWRPADAATPPVAVAARWPTGRGPIAGPWVVTSYSGLSGASAATDWNEKLSGDVALSLEEGFHRRTADRFGDSLALATPPLNETFAELPRLSLGRGREFGTWFHTTFEGLELTSGEAKDGRPVRALIDAAGARVGFADARALGDDLESVLPRILDTPLDATPEHGDSDPVRGLPRDHSLRSVTAAHRIEELTFDLRLGDGTAFRREAGAGGGRIADREGLEMSAGCVDPRKVYDAIFASEAARTGRTSPWLSHQRTRLDAGRALIGSVAGILTGSIDLVFRAVDPDTQSARYFLVDYKTNRIGASSAGHYARAWLDWEMASSGYPLQALIYTLALHRHLRTRVPGYDYDTHVGGYFYLFVRGMSGRDTPRDPSTGRCLGVLGDRWSKEAIETLDAALCPAQGAAR